MGALLTGLSMGARKAGAPSAPERQLPAAAAVVFSADGARLACVGREVALYRLARWKREWSLKPLHHPRHAMFSPTGDELVLKNVEGAIAMIDVHTGRALWSLEQYTDGRGSAVGYSACGRYLVDGGANGALNVRSAADGELDFRCQFHAESITHVERVPGSIHWLVAHQPFDPHPGETPGHASVTLHGWPFDGRVTRRDVFDDKTRVEALAVAPDGSHYAVVLGGASTRELMVVGVADGVPVRREPLEAQGHAALAWAGEGGVLACAAGDHLEIREASMLAPRRRLAIADVMGLQFSPDARSLAVAGRAQSGVLAVEEPAAPAAA
jgi:hypothetical protein